MGRGASNRDGVRAGALLIALAVATSMSLVLANARRLEVLPPCGSWVGCEMSLRSGLYEVFGQPAWGVPLVAAPVGLVCALIFGRWPTTVWLALAAGTALKGEWTLIRMGWVCPWCSISTLALLGAAILSLGVNRLRASGAYWGAALVLLGAPLAFLRSPSAPRVPGRAFPPPAADVATINRIRLLGVDDADRGGALFIGHPQASGAREIVLPWIRTKREEGRHVAFRPLGGPRDLGASILLSLMWRDGHPGWEVLFNPAFDLTKREELRLRLGYSPKTLIEERLRLTQLAGDTLLLGFREPLVLIDCPPREPCRQVE